MLIVENVEEFEINAEQFEIYESNSHYEVGPTFLWIEFKRSIHLGQINDYVAGSIERIEELRIKGLHLPGSDLCSHVQFFSLQELQENVEELNLVVNMTLNMTCFRNYCKLNFIIIGGSYEPFENRTALIYKSWRVRNINIGINGLRCPANCVCRYRGVLNIDCRSSNHRQIPPLPIPPRIRLIYTGMQLMQFPTLPGYMEVFNLNVSYNQMGSLAAYQIPRNLSQFDISFKPIKTIISEVHKYLNGRPIRIKQRPINWITNCDERAFVKLLQKISYNEKWWQTIVYEFYAFDFDRECPRKCQCCFVQKTENFVIDCSSKAMDYGRWPNFSLFRTLSKLTLLLGNCSLTELPKNLAMIVKNCNITHLDLRHNYLISLDEKTVDFYKKHDNYTIDLYGNPWNCICKLRSFLFFLKTRSPEEYRLALARCEIPMSPDGCVCCPDNLNSNALNVDCRGQRLTQFPLLPDCITSLDLRDNNVTEINQQSQTLLNNKILARRLMVFLSGSPWDYTCEFLSHTKSIAYIIQDFIALECSNLGKPLVMVEESDICPSSFIYTLLLFVFIMTIITGLNAFVYFKQPILMWFYEHEICMSMAVRMDLERMKKFDAFLCFTHKDEHLIEDYVERLENGERKFRLCFYLRDWNVGASIPECIIQSVKDSRRIIILMTNNFLESTWGKLEFRLALHATSKDRCKRLIVILYPDVENFDDLDSELKAYMVLNLRRDSPNFWNKLVYSMPHIPLFFLYI